MKLARRNTSTGLIVGVFCNDEEIAKIKNKKKILKKKKISLSAVKIKR